MAILSTFRFPLILILLLKASMFKSPLEVVIVLSFPDAVPSAIRMFPMNAEENGRAFDPR